MTDPLYLTMPADGTLSIVVNQRERDRRALRLAAGLRPGPAEVGVYSGVPRNYLSGITFTPGTVVENATIAGRLSVPAQSGQDQAPVILRNCELVGPITSPTAGDGILSATGANHVPVILEDCTLRAQSPNYFRNGIMGHRFTMRGCDVYDLVDGVDIFNGADKTGPMGVTIEGSRFHDLSYFPANPAGAPGSQTHNDPLQIMGGSGIRIVGNVFEGTLGGGALNTHGTNTANSCIMIKPDSGGISDLVIRNNWFSGGRVPINLAQDGSRTLGDGIVVADNVFEGGSDVDLAVLMPATAIGVVCTGNVNADGTPARISRNG